MNAHPHTLDEVIGTNPRTGAEIAADLSKSAAFVSALDRAIAGSLGTDGATFAIRVRLALARELTEGRIEE